MIPVAIALNTVHYDPMARGLWCRSPYQNHPKGCPNFPKCIQSRPDFRDIADKYRWMAVQEVFDLEAHAKYIKERILEKSNVEWTERQCRNPLYWQGGVRSRLHKKAKALNGDIILDIPEACGVDVFKTMSDAGVILERTNPKIVRKIMLVGFRVCAP